MKKRIILFDPVMGKWVGKSGSDEVVWTTFMGDAHQFINENDVDVFIDINDAKLEEEFISTIILQTVYSR